MKLIFLEPCTGFVVAQGFQRIEGCGDQAFARCKADVSGTRICKDGCACKLLTFNDLCRKFGRVSGVSVL